MFPPFAFVSIPTMISRFFPLPFLLLGLLAGPAVAQQVPVVLNYQATLAESGQQVEGDLPITARVFAEQTGGQLLWEERRSAVSVEEGRLSLLLGSVKPFPTDLFDAPDRYLEIEIDGERMPRLRMASTAYALRAQRARRADVADAVASDAAVSSINQVSGALTIRGDDGATVNVDPSTGTIIVSAPGGSGTSGIFGIQNSDGAIQIVDPSGPTTTINVQPGGIGSQQIADGSVETADLADDGVTTRKIADGAVTTGKLAPGTAVTALTAGGGLQGTRTTGAVTLSIADDGVTAERLAENAVTRRALASGVVVDALNGLAGGIDLTSSDQSINIGPAPGSIDLTLSPDGAVTSINTLRGELQFAATGGASVTVDESTGTITFAAPQADGTGIAGVQNTDGTLQITNPSGPTATINLQNNGIGEAQLDDQSVTADKIQDGAVGTAAIGVGAVTGTRIAGGAVGTAALANGAVTDQKLNANGTATPGQVLGFDGAGLAWVSTAAGDITAVTGAGGLSAGGTQGDVQLSILNGGITEPKFATGAVSSRALADGTVAQVDLAPGAAVTTLGVGTEALSGDVLLQGGSNISVSRVTNQNAYQIDFTGTLDGAVTSVAGVNGLATVVGPTGDVQLGVENQGIGTVQISDGAVTRAKLNQTGIINGALVEDNSLTAVDLASRAVGLAELDADSPVSSGQVLGFDGTGLAWTDLPSADGDITGVTAEGGLSGSASSGEVILSIADGGVTGPRLATSALAAGDNVNIVRDGNGNLEVSAPNVLTSVATDGATLTGDGNTTPLQIMGGGITSTELRSDAVTAAAIATGAVGTDELADGSIAAVDVNASGATNGYALIYDDTVAGGNSLVWRDPDASASSMRFKTGVETLNDARSIVERLRGVRFDWTEDGRSDIGLIAEEVATVLPELVTYEADGTTVRGLRYAPLVAVLIETTKAQQRALDTATDTVEAQRTELEALNDRVARLEALVQSMAGSSSVDTP